MTRAFIRRYPKLFVQIFEYIRLKTRVFCTLIGANFKLVAQLGHPYVLIA